MLAGLVLVVAMLGLLWGLSRRGDRADDTDLTPAVADRGIDGTSASPTTATLAPTSASSATTVAPTSAAPTTEQRFVNDVEGPVLESGVDGTIVQVSGRMMRRIDLATGAVDDIDLERLVSWQGPESGIVIAGKLVAAGNAVTGVIVTDLSDGAQREVGSVIEDSFGIHVAGQAGQDSAWLASYPEPDGVSTAVEVHLDGEVGRRIEIPHPFEIRWAYGDELILGSPDGSWRYGVSTGVATRVSGAVLAFHQGVVMTATCAESLECEVLIDRGDGPEIIGWPTGGESFGGRIEISPDLSGALAHTYSQAGTDYTYIDVRSGGTVDLGTLGIDPYLGVAWVEDSRWIIGRQQNSGSHLRAVDTETGTQVDLVPLPARGIETESFMTFLPSG